MAIHIRVEPANLILLGVDGNDHNVSWRGASIGPVPRSGPDARQLSQLRSRPPREIIVHRSCSRSRLLGRASTRASAPVGRSNP